MMCCRKVQFIACFFAVVTLATSSAHAQWTMIENFDQYDVDDDLDGLSNGFGEWTATPGFFLVEEDPTDADNRVLLVDEVDTGTKNSYLDDPRINVADGTTATLFLRFYRGEFDSHVNFGLSDVEDPSQWADYEAQARDRYGEFFSRAQGNSWRSTTSTKCPWKNGSTIGSSRTTRPTPMSTTCKVSPFRQRP